MIQTITSELVYSENDYLETTEIDVEMMGSTHSKSFEVEVLADSSAMNDVETTQEDRGKYRVERNSKYGLDVLSVLRILKE